MMTRFLRLVPVGFNGESITRVESDPRTALGPIVTNVRQAPEIIIVSSPSAAATMPEPAPAPQPVHRPETPRFGASYYGRVQRERMSRMEEIDLILRDPRKPTSWKNWRPSQHR